MSNFILLGICLVAGVLLRKWKRLPAETPQVLNNFIFYLSLPSMILLQIHDLTVSREAFLPVGAIWLMFFLSALFFWGYSKLVKFKSKRSLDFKTIGTLILTGGLSNTSFVGLPMLAGLYGPSSLKMGVLLDQLGSFLAVSTFGIFIASFYSARTLTFRKVMGRIFSFPPTYALIIAFLLRPFHYSPLISEVLTRIGDTLTPLALVSVGSQLKLDLSVLRKHARPLGLGLFVKLFLGPALIAALYLGVFHQESLFIQVAITEAAMAPMITSAIIAAEYELNSELASLMVGVGIPLSFLTVPLWVYVLGLLHS